MKLGELMPPQKPNDKYMKQIMQMAGQRHKSRCAPQTSTVRQPPEGGDEDQELPNGTFKGEEVLPPGTFRGDDELPPGTFRCDDELSSETFRAVKV
jgi:hypothetical protein